MGNRLVFAAAMAILLCHCASLPRQAEKLRVWIDPGVLTMGSVVSLTVEAPVPMQSLEAQLSLGGPVYRIPLREPVRRWTFKTQIPFHPGWRAGNYEVVVRALGAGKEPMEGIVPIVTK